MAQNHFSSCNKLKLSKIILNSDSTCKSKLSIVAAKINKKTLSKKATAAVIFKIFMNLSI